MSNDTRDLVVMITCGPDQELSSIGFTIANGGLTAGLRVSVFLTSSGVDVVRKRATDTTQVHPLEPLSQMIGDFLKTRRRALGLHTLRQSAGLRRDRPDRRRRHYRREQDA